MSMQNEIIKKNGIVIFVSFILYLFDPFFIFFIVPFHLYSLINDSQLRIGASSGVLFLLISFKSVLQFNGLLNSGAAVFLVILGMSPPLVLLISVVLFYEIKLNYKVRSVTAILLVLGFVEILGFAAVLIYESDLHFALTAKERIKETLLQMINMLYGESSINTFVGTSGFAAYIIEIVKKSYLLIFFIQFGISFGIAWELYKRFYKRTIKSLMNQITVPDWIIWPFLISWTLVLLDIIVSLGSFASIAWNTGFVFALFYILNGLAIYQAILLKKYKKQVSGVKLILLFAISQFIPIVNVVIIFIVLILGISELWISYRT
ncbi:MAG: hypothetical protein K9L24_00040 [Spirochaetia bacterium]|nr:hypothetical protein [Spirochaetia bacterium]